MDSLFLFQSLAFFLAGAVGTGILMMIRGDFLGRRAAEEAEGRLFRDIKASEDRLNVRIDREMVSIFRELQEIKDAIVRLEGK